ncbi:hypothetical protein [Myroides sp. DF42-4-2]|uniref:hypothetical protein n=1 Tax=unclassified Myroides TaxID=2642485 RepID=UPI0025774E9B|nr:hypothetical protein [Myroides sp. DF42-4-2]
MKKGILKIKVDYKPLNTYKNVVVRSGSNRQNYNANTRYFEPDRRIDPYVVLVECGVNDTHDIVTGLVNANLTDVSWKQSTPSGYKEIEATDREFKIGTGADKGKITIFKNVSDTDPVTILFSARFMDSTTKRVVNFQESFNLITLPVAQAPILIETSAPVGYNLFPTENNQGLVCQADLYQGAEKLPAAYWWYKGNTLLTNSNGYFGTAKNQLFVPASALSKTGDVFKCEVADCSEYFNGLVDQKVEADPEVVEWRRLYQQESENLIGKYNSDWGKWATYTNVVKIPDYDSVRVWKVNDTTSTAVGVINSTNFDLIKDVEYKVQLLALPYFDPDLKTLLNYCYIMHPSGNIGLDVIKWKKITDVDIVANNKGHMMELVFSVPRNMVGARFLIGARRPAGEYSNPNYFGFYFKNLKLSVNTESEVWSPSKKDIQDLINQKKEYYKTQTSLPENYRPNPKPAKLYTADFMLMKKFPEYHEEVLYPTSVSPESATVQVEMVLNTNNGIIQQPERFFSVGWLKQANGTFKYKGFKVNIAIADIKALNDANKQLDYELREDLTLKP